MGTDHVEKMQPDDKPYKEHNYYKNASETLHCICEWWREWSTPVDKMLYGLKISTLKRLNVSKAVLDTPGPLFTKP